MYAGCISWFAPIFAHLAEACHGTSLELSFLFYVTCLCNPNELLPIRNSTTEAAKPSIEDLLAPMLGNTDSEKGGLSSVTGGIAVAASGPESLVCQARNAVAKVGPNVESKVGGVRVHTELFAL